MSDIDKILEEVEDSMMAKKTTERETVLASEVRRLRAKLVAAAIDVARMSWLEYGVNPTKCIDDAEKKYGIRLKFEDGRFGEAKS